MWNTTLLGGLLLLVVVVVEGLTQAQYGPMEYDRDDETPNVETPYLVTLQFQMESIISKFFINQQEYIDERLEALESRLEEKCGAVDTQVQQESEIVDIDEFSIKLAGLMNTFVGKVAEVGDTVVSNVEDKLNTLSSEVINGVENKVSSLVNSQAQMQEQLSAVATQDDMIQLKSKISTLTALTVADMKSVLSTLATDALVSTKLQELADVELAQIKQLILDLALNVTACENNDILDGILPLLESSKKEREQLLATLEASTSLLSERYTHNAKNLTKIFQNLTQEVDENEEVLSGVTKMVNEMESDVSSSMRELLAAVQEIFNNTKSTPPPPTTTSTTTTTTTTSTTTPPPTSTTPPVLQPCLDSTFRGSNAFARLSPSSINICSAAIRFEKCHLQFVSFHCCQSCTEAGQIPSMGPWRYLNYSREVNILQALNFMRP